MKGKVYTVIFRHDTEPKWTEHNPVLGKDEPSVTTDTLGMKIGDGETRWTDLPWFIAPDSTATDRGWFLTGLKMGRV